MKFFDTEQIAAIDAYTVAHEPIDEADLMERAASAVADWILSRFGADTRVAVMVGPGNNGGDALVVSRLLAARSWKVTLFIPDFGRATSPLHQSNLDRLVGVENIEIHYFDASQRWIDLSEFKLIVDGLFGSGLKRPLHGFAAQVVHMINYAKATVVAIDMPSGLMGEESRDPLADNVVKADYTLSFQFPKLSFMFRENEEFVGKFELLPIGLHPEIIATLATPWNYTDLKAARALLIQRRKFAHKGHFGHLLLVAGSRGKMGAAHLAAKAALLAGAGLVTVHLPACGADILQTSLPEAMVSVDAKSEMVSETPSPESFRAVAIGPGLGRDATTAAAFFALLKRCGAQMVIDADAINILAEHPDWLEFLHPNDILTPHPTEFERLIGKKAVDDLERLQYAREFSQRYRTILVLKGAHTAVVFPEGEVWFNSTGNPGMATAGSGDVLTGILVGLLSQGYTPRDAALLGVFLHGLSADLWVDQNAVESLMAGDIAENLGRAFAQLRR